MSAVGNAGVRLTVMKGDARDQGRVITLRLGHCLMIGRSPDVSNHTGMITQHSLARLDDEDTAAVNRHLQGRAPHNDGARAMLASFDRDEDIGLGDDSVSTMHAMFFCDEAGLTLLDLGSTNGTFVNGHRVTSADVLVNDVLRLGETRFAVAVAAPTP